jgi:hypothetical protein
MVNMMNKLKLAVLAVLSLFIFSTKSQAYLDPGTGSYVLQIVLAFVIGGLYSLKLYWKRIKAYFQRKYSKKEDSAETH